MYNKNVLKWNKKCFFQCHISLETVGNLFVFVSCWTLKEFLDEKEGWVVPLGDVKSWEKEKGFELRREVKNKTVLMFIWKLILNWNSMKNKECFAKPWETLLDFLIDLKDLLIHYYK